MFPYSESGPVRLTSWVQIGGVTFEAEIVDADGATRTAQVIRLGTLFEQSVPFSCLASVALKEGAYVLQAFGRVPEAKVPEWVHFAEVQS